MPGRAPRTIALVGNGDVDAALSDAIDAHDLVVRFNAARHCGVAGKRTDILVVNNIGEAGRAVTDDIRPAAFESLGEIWFAHGKRLFGAKRADYSADLIALFRGVPHRRFPSFSSSRAKRALRAFGLKPGKTASKGAIFLHLALTKWPDAKISIYGFGHQGWDGHDWAAERAWVNSLVNDGRVRRSSLGGSQKMGWKCSICGVEHDEVPDCFGIEAPWRALVTDDDFDARVELTADYCIVDDETFFVRGHIQIPIHGNPNPLAFSVWSSLSRENFLHMADRSDAVDRANDKPYFGWLCSPVPVYPGTIHLRLSVQSRPPGLTPLFVIQDDDHPLAHDQRNGIDVERWHRLALQLMA